MTGHLCHAIGCSAHVPPRLLMCPYHWEMVPADIKKRVKDHYRVGQCDRRDPSREWMNAAKAAVNAVRGIERAKKNPAQTN